MKSKHPLIPRQDRWKWSARGLIETFLATILHYWGSTRVQSGSECP